MSHSPAACLKRIPIFKNVSDETINSLTQVSTHRQYFKKGEFIATPSSQSSLIAIDQGKAKIFTLSPNGKEKILYIAEKGSINGQDNLLSNKEMARYMQATEDTWVCSIKHDDFQNFLKASPEVAVSLLNSIGTKLIDLEINTSRRDLLKAKDRVYSYLQDWQKKQATNEFTLPIKKIEFANLLGITPETLSRQLKQLVDEKRIKMNGKKITILK